MNTTKRYAFIIFHYSPLFPLKSFTKRKNRTRKKFQNGQWARDKTRPDTRLPKSRAGGQLPYLRLPDHLGKSSEVKKIKS